MSSNSGTLAESPTSKCLVRGSINVDEFYHVPHIVKPGQTISSTGTTKRLGGKGGNQAKALACAGGVVIMDATVGDDAEGRWAVTELCAIAGGGGRIEQERIQFWKEGVTGKAVIQLAEDGENSIIILAGANHAKTPLYEPLVPTTVAHLLLANEIPLTSTLAYLASATSSNVTTVFNPSPMLSSQQVHDFPWSQVDWLLVNEGELEEIATALCGELRPAAAGEEDFVAFTRQLAEKVGSGTNICCTLGSRGIYVSTSAGKAVSHSVSFESPAGKLLGPVVDTTGAGDCFAGYFTAGLMRQARGGVDRGKYESDLREIVGEAMTVSWHCNPG